MPERRSTPASGAPGKAIYIAWTRYQRRPVSMQREFDYELFFLTALPGSVGLRKALFSYPVQAYRTLQLILKLRPDLIWVQLPPSFLAHTIYLARLLLGGKTVLIGDLHNSALSKRWVSVPLTRRLLNSFDILLAHNEPTRQAARKLGFDDRRLLVLEDSLPSIADETMAAPGIVPGLFVVPCSFNRDEPIRHVLEAAFDLPEFRFMLTGDRGKAERLGYLTKVPDNVTFTGFIPTTEYEKLLNSATGVLCLTTEDGIQLSAAAEAVGSGKPMIISGTPLLRTLFGTGLFVDNSKEEIRDACRVVAADYDGFAARTRHAREDVDREERWQSQVARIRQHLARKKTPHLN